MPPRDAAGRGARRRAWRCTRSRRRSRRCPRCAASSSGDVHRELVDDRVRGLDRPRERVARPSLLRARATRFSTCSASRRMKSSSSRSTRNSAAALADDPADERHPGESGRPAASARAVSVARRRGPRLEEPREVLQVGRADVGAEVLADESRHQVGEGARGRRGGGLAATAAVDSGGSCRDVVGSRVLARADGPRRPGRARSRCAGARRRGRTRWARTRPRRARPRARRGSGHLGERGPQRVELEHAARRLLAEQRAEQASPRRLGPASDDARPVPHEGEARAAEPRAHSAEVGLDRRVADVQAAAAVSNTSMPSGASMSERMTRATAHRRRRRRVAPRFACRPRRAIEAVARRAGLDDRAGPRSPAPT